MKKGRRDEAILKNKERRGGKIEGRRSEAARLKENKGEEREEPRLKKKGEDRR